MHSTCNGSFIVQAPAGSGKTELLAQRVLALLACVAQPESILAITFTRKAAAEMRERIVGALRAVADPASAARPLRDDTRELARAALAADARHGWGLLANPGRLRIQTIDSLNHMLAHRLPVLSGLGAEVEAEDHARHSYRLAAERLLLHLDDGESAYAAVVRRVLVHLDNRVPAFVDLVGEMLQRREAWLPVLPIGALDDRRKRAARLRGGLEAVRARPAQFTLASLLEAPADGWLDRVVACAARAATALNSKYADAPIAACAAGEMPGCGSCGPGRLAGACGTGADEGRNPAQQVRRHGSAWAATAQARRSPTKPGPCATNSPGDRTRSRSCTPRADCRQRATRISSGICCSHCARCCGSPPRNSTWCSPSAGASITRAPHWRPARRWVPRTSPPTRRSPSTRSSTHVLVDEFQDTSESQVQLLRRLTAGWEPGDGRTLFLVGDPMQSIYRFRNAEVGLFLEVRDHGLGPLRPEALTLAVNFRSTQPIVAWVNRSFGSVLGTSRRRAARPGCLRREHAGDRRPATRVASRCTLAVGRSAEQEAREIADVVERRLAETAQRVDGGPGRVAILVRSRAHLQAIVPELRARGIAWRASDIDPLATRPVVRDLRALTAALEHRGDRTAWLATLRAPWCGLALADLYALCGEERERPLIDLLRDDAGSRAPGPDARDASRAGPARTRGGVA